MKILLDTHALLWFAKNDPRLSDSARRHIEDDDNTSLYSIASVWEMAIKHGLGKLTIAWPIYPQFANLLKEFGFQQLAISYRHASSVAELPRRKEHRDPFDRLLIAQAVVEDLPIVSHDRAFDLYSVSRIW